MFLLNCCIISVCFNMSRSCSTMWTLNLYHVSKGSLMCALYLDGCLLFWNDELQALSLYICICAWAYCRFMGWTMQVCNYKNSQGKDASLAGERPWCGCIAFYVPYSWSHVFTSLLLETNSQYVIAVDHRVDFQYRELENIHISSYCFVGTLFSVLSPSQP